MITITRNQNFKEWINITMFGKLIDNCKGNARAMHVARKLQIKHKAETGEKLYIKQKTI